VDSGTMNVSRLTADTDAAIVAVCRDSVIVGAFESAAGRAARAYHGSRTARWIGEAIGEVSSDSGFGIGVVLLTAAVVHTLLLTLGPGLLGWRALLIPAIAAAQGAVLMLMANAGRS
jgi:hypothetical protein